MECMEGKPMAFVKHVLAGLVLFVALCLVCVSALVIMGSLTF